MINYKRSVVAAVVLALFLSLFARGAVAAQKEIKIVASFYPMYIMTRNVAKNVPGVFVENLTPPFTGCLHDYALTPADMKKLSDAKVLAVNGAGMESFLESVTAQHPELNIVNLSEGIPLIKSGQEDNPHVWVSVSAVIAQVKNLGAAMGKIDPAHKGLYEKNTDNYVIKLEALREKMHTELAAYRGRNIITFHEAFPYFAAEFGLKIAAVVEREPGSEPSAKELADTVELIRNSGRNTCVLFSEPQYPSAAAGVIAQETGLEVYVLDPAVSGPDENDAYIKIMEKNLDVLKKAFGK
ncbi:MAG: metal ABC transporter substrate-binding protein [Candidatus Omnitrophota bacterium]|jgi:zinc transport system substrate-binding protein